MLNVLKSFVNTLSAYSFAPLPYYEDEGDRYRLMFAPLVGVVIYWISYGWFMLGWYRHFEDAAIALGVVLITIIVSGGRHVLGFIAYIDSIPTYKYRFSSWSASRDRGVLRFILVMLVWIVAMVNTYDYLFNLLLMGFILARILMGLLTSAFSEFSNQSKIVKYILIIGFFAFAYYVLDEYEDLAIYPIVITLASFICFINPFRRVTAEKLSLLEDDYVVTAETAWIISVAMISLVRSL